jgi:hypothetical protein
MQESSKIIGTKKLRVDIKPFRLALYALATAAGNFLRGSDDAWEILGFLPVLVKLFPHFSDAFLPLIITRLIKEIIWCFKQSRSRILIMLLKSENFQLQDFQNLVI